MNKYKFIKKIIVIGLIAISFSSFSQSEDNWELALSKNGVEIYTRKTDGHVIKEFKAITDVNLSAGEVRDLLANPETYPDWMNSVKEAHLIKKENGLYYIYSRIDVPWPFDDRDEISTTEFVEDSVSGDILCKINILEDYGNEKKGLVRIKEGYGKWILKNNEDGGCKVTFQFYADPGGHLPKNIVNMFIENSPYKTLLALKKMK